MFFDLAREHPHLLFLVFTNSLLLDEKKIGQFSSIPNLIPILSLEGKQLETDLRRGTGVFGSVLTKMSLLKERKIFFGTSFTLTRRNFELITTYEFQKNLSQKGIGYPSWWTLFPLNPVRKIYA
jgi:MoaA/NifB/PqqE/SkfB family radical SAM enzyme